MSTWLLETCRENWNKYIRKKKCESSWLFTRIMALVAVFESTDNDKWDSRVVGEISLIYCSKDVGLLQLLHYSWLSVWRSTSPLGTTPFSFNNAFRGTVTSEECLTFMPSALLSNVEMHFVTNFLLYSNEILNFKHSFPFTFLKCMRMNTASYYIHNRPYNTAARLPVPH